MIVVNDEEDRKTRLLKGWQLIQVQIESLDETDILQDYG
jgi:hypothetical protein